MRLPEEIVAASFAPTWRSMLARRLHARGLPQTEIASLLGITQSAVSKHLAGRLGSDPRLESHPRMVETVERVAAGLAEKRLSPVQVLVESMALVREFETRGPLCRIHEEEMPSLQGMGCDLCVLPEARLAPEQAAIQDLKGALRILEAVPALARFLPHVGTNVVRAVPGAKDVTGVAAVPGGLYEVRGRVKVPAPPEMGVSRHVAEVLLSVHRQDANRLACLNVSPAPALLEAFRAGGLHAEEVDPRVEREPARLVFPRGVPDVFHHGGAFGVEPQAYVVAASAQALALKLKAALDRVSPDFD